MLETYAGDGAAGGGAEHVPRGDPRKTAGSSMAAKAGVTGDLES